MSVCFACVALAEGEALESLNNFVDLIKTALLVAAKLIIVSGAVVFLYSFISHDNSQRWGGAIAGVLAFVFHEIIELYL